jgi:hypothetical protein
MFSPTRLVTGFGAAWATDFEHPVVVRVDPARLTGTIWAAVPGGTHDQGPRAVAAGLGPIWLLPAQGSTLLQIDPARGTLASHDLPFPLTSICAGWPAEYPIRAAPKCPARDRMDCPVNRTGKSTRSSMRAFGKAGNGDTGGAILRSASAV